MGHGCDSPLVWVGLSLAEPFKSWRDLVVLVLSVRGDPWVSFPGDVGEMTAMSLLAGSEWLMSRLTPPATKAPSIGCRS